MQKSNCSYSHVGEYNNGITKKHLLDFTPNTSKLQANKAALAVSRSGVIEDYHMKSLLLVEFSINSCFFKSVVCFRDYKKHM